MRCTFCKTEMEKGTGKMFVWNSGKLDYFCSSKCEKNRLKLKRNPRKVNWIRKKVKKK